MTLLDERLAFCTHHPGGSVAPGEVRFLLTALAGPDGILELSDGDGRALLAVLVEGCANAADAADFALLGHRPGPSTEAMAEAALAWAVARARRGPRANLDAPGPEQGLFSEALLKRHGFTEAFRLHEMERPPGPPPGLPELPPGLRVADLEPGWIPSLHEAVARAFATVPGACVAPLPEFTERMRSHPIPPRVILAGERVVGFVRVTRDPDGAGRIQSLGRHPDAAGSGLGPRLLAEGLRLLAERGAGLMRLEVVAENARALGLYRRAGFTVVRSTSTWRRGLACGPGGVSGMLPLPLGEGGG